MNAGAGGREPEQDGPHGQWQGVFGVQLRWCP